MGMDHSLARRGDGQMVLAVAEGDQQHIADLHRAGRGNQAGPSRMVQPVGDREIAQGITERSEWLCSDRLECCGHQTETVEPCLWIASMEAEGAADQLFGRLGKGLAPIRRAQGWP